MASRITHEHRHPSISPRKAPATQTPPSHIARRVLTGHRATPDITVTIELVKDLIQTGKQQRDNPVKSGEKFKEAVIKAKGAWSQSLSADNSRRLAYYKAMAYLGLAKAIMRQGKFEKASAYCVKGLECEPQTAEGAMPPLVAKLRLCLIRCHILRGEFLAAETIGIQTLQSSPVVSDFLLQAKVTVELAKAIFHQRKPASHLLKIQEDLPAAPPPMTAAQAYATLITDWTVQATIQPRRTPYLQERATNLLNSASSIHTDRETLNSLQTLRQRSEMAFRNCNPAKS